MAKGGRKPKHDYEDPMLIIQIEGWARDGFDDKQIAEMLGLNESYFCTQKKTFPKLSKAIQAGRKPLNVFVENSWYKRITGMKTTTETMHYTYVKKENGDVEEVLTGKTVVVNEIPPDAGAARNWLIQRKPEVWNKQPAKVAATDPSGENSAPLLFLSADHLTEDQIQEYINKNISGGDDDTETGNND